MSSAVKIEDVQAAGVRHLWGTGCACWWAAYHSAIQTGMMAGNQLFLICSGRQAGQQHTPLTCRPTGWRAGTAVNWLASAAQS